ncbi:MAG TPA: hypothetical protein VHK22_02720 [Gaiellaceae bacterium]|nr:hypothetical protein [Gaiellaceae bacterium]
MSESVEAERPLQTPNGVADYDLHGLAGVRLVGARPQDVAAVGHQLGGIRGTLGREPDILIRFVDNLPLAGARLLGAKEAAFTDDAFLVLRSKHKTSARVSIPLADVGGQCEIVCERGLPAVPLLIPILNLTVLARGALPLHASAFLHSDLGVVATGWSKGGKTETLLAFAAHGARYVGDEWVYVDLEHGTVVGIPEAVRLWDWHLDQLPDRVVPAARRMRLRLGRLVVSTADRLTRDGTSSAAPARLLRRSTHLVEGQLHVDVPPAVLFGTASSAEAPFDRLLFVASHESPEIVVEPVDPLEVARRMAFSLAFERRDLSAHYAMYRFAFPDTVNPVLERVGELEREALERAFAGKPAFAVRHPYPVSFERLYEALEPFCDAGGGRNDA